jgi:hypothetical protein
VVELQAPAANDAAVTTQSSSGPNALTAVRFQGKKASLELTEGSEAMQGGSSK